MQNTLEKNIYGVCRSCGYVAEAYEKKCPHCGRQLQNKQQIRILGAMLMFIGFFLIAVMGAVTSSVSSASASGFNWKAGPDATALMLAVLYLVMAFGVSCSATGLWHLVTGRRNIVLAGIMFGLAFTLFVAGEILPRVFA